MKKIAVYEKMLNTWCHSGALKHILCGNTPYQAAVLIPIMGQKQRMKSTCTMVIWTIRIHVFGTLTGSL